MSKYTPGPWKVRRDSMLDWHIECKSNIPNIPGVVARVGFEPNARLIVAAPELLKECKYVRNLIEILYPNDKELKATKTKLDRVIAKAEEK